MSTRTFPRRWKAELAPKVWIEGGRGGPGMLRENSRSHRKEPHLTFRTRPTARCTNRRTSARFTAARLLKACKSHDMLELYVLALGETGGRCESEVLWIQWEDVDLDGGFLKVVTGRNGHRTKGGKSRWVPISPRLRVALREHSLRYRAAKYDGQPSPWVFHHTKTRRHHKAGKRIRSLYSAFKAAAAQARLPPEFVQHDLRHRRVTTWLADEKSAVLVKEAVGHADLRTTMAYTHLAREHLRGLVDEPPGEEVRNRA